LGFADDLTVTGCRLSQLKSTGVSTDITGTSKFKDQPCWGTEGTVTNPLTYKIMRSGAFNASLTVVQSEGFAGLLKIILSWRTPATDWLILYLHNTTSKFRYPPWRRGTAAAGSYNNIRLGVKHSTPLKVVFQNSLVPGGRIRERITGYI
jgi:hypothetical protein